MIIGATDRMIYRRLVLPLAEQIGWRKDPVVYRAGLSNETSSLSLRSWYKSNNFAHIRSKHQLETESAMTARAHY